MFMIAALTTVIYTLVASFVCFCMNAAIYHEVWIMPFAIPSDIIADTFLRASQGASFDL